MSTTADTKSNSDAKGPDIRQLADRDLPKTPFPSDAKSDFRIALDEKIHREIQKHAKENKAVEICGVLVGKWGRDDKGPFVSITANIRGEAATNKFAEVTFTHDTWSKINAEMDKSYSGYNIVGWYHTHPDFGIFLSDRDRFIHDHFFNEPGQVAYVVDPVRDIEGMFIWQGGKAVPAPYYWTGDKMRMSPTEKEPRLQASHEKRAGATSERGGGRDDYPPGDAGPMGWITLTLGGMCFFMLGIMVSNWWVGSQMQRILDGVVASQLVDRVRLTRDIEQTLQTLQGSMAPLASVQGVQGIPPQVQGAFRDSAERMNMLAQQMLLLRRQYGLDQRELGRLAMILAQKQAELDAAMNPTTNPSAPAMGLGAAATMPSSSETLPQPSPATPSPATPAPAPSGSLSIPKSPPPTTAPTP